MYAYKANSKQLKSNRKFRLAFVTVSNGNSLFYLTCDEMKMLYLIFSLFSAMPSSRLAKISQTWTL